MSSFSIKDILLHLLHGGCVVAALFLVFINKYGIHSLEINETNYLNNLGIGVIAVLLGASYLIGLFIDAMADLIEGLLKIKSSVYHFLSKGKYMGLELGHWEKIREDLIDCAKQGFTNKDMDMKEMELNNYSNEYFKESSDYLFQCAKNKAFSKGEAYQINQIESFFRFYIFFRNLILTTILLSLILMIFIPDWFINPYFIVTIIIIIILSILFALRFSAYYVRITLGTTYSSPVAGLE